MKRRVNLFQAAMLRWRALYPYNAVHVVRLAGAPDVAGLRATLAAHLASLGLTGLELDPRRQAFEWTGGEPSVELREVETAGDARAALSAEIERELNRAFPERGRVDPFRFFVIDLGSAFELGLAYDHYVAGGDSIVRLMRGIVARLEPSARDVTSAGAAPLRRYGPSYALLLGRQVLPIIRGLPALARMAASCRRAIRMRFASPQDGYNAFLLERVDADDRARLEGRAHEWGVTTHDLLLAIILKSVSPLARPSDETARRNEIAIAAIVNIRADLGAGAKNALAPCLASFRVGHRVPRDMGMRELAVSVHAQTDVIKRSKRYLQTLVALGLTGFEWAFMSVPQRQRFFPKHFPVSAGSTPLNVDVLWRDGGATPPLDYVRGVSTGPLAPMVIAFTMVGGAINIGISFRTTVFVRPAIEGVAADMLRLIRTL
ncbi:MAG: hypothetical protein ABI981_06150 [Betaproteobacteria bacterium]